MCSKSGVSQFTTAWSGGSTSTANAVFHPLVPATSSVELHNVSLSFEIRNNSGAAKVRGAIRYGNVDGTWDTAVDFGPTATTSDGWAYDTSFTDVTALGTRKLLAQLGVIVYNDSGTDIEYCRVRVRHDSEN